MTATIQQVRRIVQRHGGTLSRDGVGGWECLAPEGKRWKEPEVWCYPLPLSEAESKDERKEMLETAVIMLSPGVEDYR